MRRLGLALELGGTRAFLLGLLPLGASVERAAAALVGALAESGVRAAILDISDYKDLLQALIAGRKQQRPGVVLALHGLEKLGVPEREAYIRRSNLTRDGLGEGNGPAVWLVDTGLLQWMGEQTPDLIRWAGLPFDLEGLLPKRPDLELLKVAVRSLDPTYPVSPNDARYVRVASWEKTATRIATALSWDGSLPIWWIAGARGSGKSTFLNALACRLTNEDREALLVRVWSEYRGAEFVLIEVAAAIVQSLERFGTGFSVEAADQFARTAGLVGVGLAGKDLLLEPLTLSARLDSVRRQEPHWQTRMMFKAMRELMDDGLQDAHRRPGRVLLLDGLDRLRPEDLQELLPILDACLSGSVVVISLAALLGGVRNWGPRLQQNPVVLHPITPRRYDRQPWLEHIDVLREIIRRRIPGPSSGGWLEEDSLDQVIYASGGEPARLLMLARDVIARLAEAAPGEAESRIVNEVIAQAKRRCSVTITRNDVNLLKSIHEKKMLNGDSHQEFDLVEQGLVQMHANGRVWFDVHPLILPELYSSDLPPVPAPG